MSIHMRTLLCAALSAQKFSKSLLHPGRHRKSYTHDSGRNYSHNAVLPFISKMCLQHSTAKPAGSGVCMCLSWTKARPRHNICGSPRCYHHSIESRMARKPLQPVSASAV